ncbi:MAG: penicillin-binding protein activator LpoB [Desulfobacteraceae bacterium]|nr:penicillin-binding protein activator LpoB [Desulfobacteraceae bacterium]MCF8093854.1 penicillin-binding protein activator LpoB [Desulfobacteraceae bacterium]
MKVKHHIFIIGALFAGITAAVALSGCRATTRDISPDESIHYDEAYDFSDKKKIVNDLVDSLVQKSPLSRGEARPVVIIYDVANRTSEHISTSGITDDIRSELLSRGTARFVNRRQRSSIQKELEYQYGGNVEPATRVEMARQVGAEYMITGTLRSIRKRQPRQARLKRKTLQYYSLTLELTSLETGLIEWSDSAEIAREAAKPFIGW